MYSFRSFNAEINGPDIGASGIGSGIGSGIIRSTIIVARGDSSSNGLSSRSVRTCKIFNTKADNYKTETPT
jgi:hypothetical protein